MLNYSGSLIKVYFDSKPLNWFKLLAADSLLVSLFQAIAPQY